MEDKHNGVVDKGGEEMQGRKDSEVKDKDHE